MLWRNSIQARQQVEDSTHKDTKAALYSKAIEIEGILQRTYHTIRTISLLPGVRASQPYNRKSDSEDIVASKRISKSDFDTIQQLYNHIAASVAVSEIYIIHDGFDPLQNEVPFIMFDHVIVDRYEETVEETSPHERDDYPEEYEDYVRQLDYFRENADVMPINSLDGIYPINSGIMLTCDNTQYHSVSQGDPKNASGFSLSVPIYDFQHSHFKGLVTAILRSNILEAALLSWPVIPVTELDKKTLKDQSIDTNVFGESFLLEEKLSNITISDRRDTSLASTYSASAMSKMEFHTKLNISGPHEWVLHSYVPLKLFQQRINQVNFNLVAQISMLSLVLCIFWYFVYRSIRYQQETTIKLNKLANFDSLTNLPNRRMLNRHMSKVLHKTPVSNEFAIIMVDVDNFKQVNDSLGHLAGDDMLIEIATRFHEALRGSDRLIGKGSDCSDDSTLSEQKFLTGLVGRLGGDEFLVILSNRVTRKSALLVAARLQDSLVAPIQLNDERIYASCSMGVAIYPENGADKETLLRNADTAVYEAKRRGRSQTVSFEDIFNEKTKLRLQMLAGLHEGLKKSEFELFYQPELHVESGRLSAAEALLRWRHPKFGLVMPMEFIPLLEQSGLIIPVGYWIIETACKQLSDWRQAGLQLTSISVNIAPQQLLKDDFVKKVKEILSKSDIAPSSLIIEVTESTFMKQPEKAIQTLIKIREIGVQIAIDDFGTGYSSLSYLRKLPLDILKIDRSFVIDANTDTGAAICEMLILLAKRLDLKVVAEGVETEEQLAILKGSDWIQGYLISRPLNVADFYQKLHTAQY